MKTTATKKESLILKGFITGVMGRGKEGRILFDNRIRSYPGHWSHNSLIVVIGSGQCNMNEFEQEWVDGTDAHYFVDMVVHIGHGGDILHTVVGKILSYSIISSIISGQTFVVDGEGTPTFEGCVDGHFWKQKCHRDTSFSEELEVWDISFQTTDFVGKRTARQLLRERGINTVINDRKPHEHWVFKTLGWDGWKNRQKKRHVFVHFGKGKTYDDITRLRKLLEGKNHLTGRRVWWGNTYDPEYTVMGPVLP